MKAILVEPERLEVSAGRIHDLTQQYEQNVKSLYEEVERMAVHWKGSDSRAFTDQILGFQDDFRQMQTLLGQYIDFLNTTAKAYRQTQEEIASLARNLVN